MKRTWGTIKEQRKKTRAKHQSFKETKRMKGETAGSYLDRVNKKYLKKLK